MTRKTKFAFLASLVLNVLLFGVLLGQSPHRLDRGTLREQRMEQVLKDLPEESQARLRERAQQVRAIALPLFAGLRQPQDEAVRLLGADPFDEAAFDRQARQVRKLRAEMTEKLSREVKSATTDLTPEERRRFAELLRRPPPARS